MAEIDFVVPLSIAERLTLESIHAQYIIPILYDNVDNSSTDSGPPDPDSEMEMKEQDSSLIKELEHMVNDIQNQLLSTASTNDCLSLFGKWQWAIKLRGYLEGAMEGEALQIEHGGDREAAYRRSLNEVCKVEGRLYQKPAILELNRDFVERLRGKQFSAVKFLPSKADAEHWHIVSDMDLLNGLDVENKFTIWQMASIFCLGHRRVANSREIQKRLFMHQSFKEKFQITRASVPDVNESQPTSGGVIPKYVICERVPPGETLVAF